MIDNEEFYARTFLNAGEIDLEIEKLETEKIDKRSKEFKEWKNKMNFLIEKYNNEVGHKAMKIIK